MTVKPNSMARFAAVAAIAAAFPPRETARIIIGKKPSDPARLATAEDKRSRKNRKRLLAQ